MYKDIKQILKHSLIYGLGIYIGKAVGFLMIPVYTRFLSPSDYGVITLLNLTSWLIGILLAVGISSSVYRFYFQYGEDERKDVISSALIFITFLSILVIIILSIFSHSISNLVFKESTYAYYLQLIFISTLFDMIAILPGAYIRVLRKSVFFSILALSRLGLALSLNIYLIVFLKMGVKGVLWSGIYSSLFMAAVSLVYTIRKVKLRFSIDKLKGMLKYGFPLMPETIFVFFIHFSSRYFLQHFFGLKEVGIFSLGYKFSILLPFLISQPFGLIWSTYRFEVANRENANEFYSRILTYYFLVSISFCLFLSVFIKDIIRIVATPAFYSAYHIVPLVTLGFVFWGLSTVFDTGILLRKKTYFKTLTAALAMVISLFLNYLLIPRIGIFGAAIASFCSFFSLSLMSFVISTKLYPIPFEWQRMAKTSFAAVLVYILTKFIKTDNIYLSLSLKSLAMLAFISLLFLLKFFNQGELNRLRKLKDKIIILIKNRGVTIARSQCDYSNL